MGMQQRRMPGLVRKVRRHVSRGRTPANVACSVRAWRGLRFNEKYAVKLAQKKARQAEKAKAAAEKPSAPKSNPFSVRRFLRLVLYTLIAGQLSASVAAAGPFGLGSQIFGAESIPEPSFEGFGSNEEKSEEKADEEQEDRKSVV